jgi:hypothetical protein
MEGKKRKRQGVTFQGVMRQRERVPLPRSQSDQFNGGYLPEEEGFVATTKKISDSKHT